METGTDEKRNFTVVDDTAEQHEESEGRKRDTVCSNCHNPLGINTTPGAKSKKHDR